MTEIFPNDQMQSYPNSTLAYLNDQSGRHRLTRRGIKRKKPKNNLGDPKKASHDTNTSSLRSFKRSDKGMEAHTSPWEPMESSLESGRTSSSKFQKSAKRRSHKKDEVRVLCSVNDSFRRAMNFQWSLSTNASLNYEGQAAKPFPKCASRIQVQM